MERAAKRPRFTCDFGGCGYTTVYPSNLAVHKQVHTGIKPYKCEFDGCGYATFYPSNLIVHERRHRGDKPYRCDVDGCGARFSDWSVYRRHERTHTGEKPYQCDMCDYASATSGSLTRHKRTHTGEKPTSVTSVVSVLRTRPPAPPTSGLTPRVNAGSSEGSRWPPA